MKGSPGYNLPVCEVEKIVFQVKQGSVKQGQRHRLH
jgi:hypothetical protein